jgi:integrase/recombinase XerD
MTVAKRVWMSGPLTKHVQGFRAELLRDGYSKAARDSHLRLMAAVSCWLEQRGLAPADLVGEEVQRFLLKRQRAHEPHRCKRALAPLLGFLRGVGAVPPEPVAPPRKALLGQYERYLVEERAVLPARREDYIARAIAFIGERDVAELTARDVTDFVVTRADEPSLAASLTALRSLLRFLFLTGRSTANLVYAVPTSSRWRQATLPKALTSVEVRTLLATCDRRTTVGRRSYAALLLMLRLGLRAGEVAALALDDIDWKAGEIVVHGKGGTISKLPLPVDVGDALVAYLRCSRRQPTHRSVFLHIRAPFRPTRASTIVSVARTAFSKAGILRGGGHRLRHTAATEMLRKGASLTEIAQVLRHRHFDTTAIYAKVDRSRLRALARPWPNVVRSGYLLRDMAQPWPGGVR